MQIGRRDESSESRFGKGRLCKSDKGPRSVRFEQPRDPAVHRLELNFPGLRSIGDVPNPHPFHGAEQLGFGDCTHRSRNGESEGSTVKFQMTGLLNAQVIQPTHCGANAFIERNLNRHQRIIRFQSGLRSGCSDSRCAGQVGNIAGGCGIGVGRRGGERYVTSGHRKRALNPHRLGCDPR